MNYEAWLDELDTISRQADVSIHDMPNNRYYWHEGFTPSQTFFAHVA